MRMQRLCYYVKECTATSARMDFGNCQTRTSPRDVLNVAATRRVLCPERCATKPQDSASARPTQKDEPVIRVKMYFSTSPCWMIRYVCNLDWVGLFWIAYFVAWGISVELQQVKWWQLHVVQNNQQTMTILYVFAIMAVRVDHDFTEMLFHEYS